MKLVKQYGPMRLTINEDVFEDDDIFEDDIDISKLSFMNRDLYELGIRDIINVDIIYTGDADDSELPIYVVSAENHHDKDIAAKNMMKIKKYLKNTYSTSDKIVVFDVQVELSEDQENEVTKAIDCYADRSEEQKAILSKVFDANDHKVNMMEHLGFININKYIGGYEYRTVMVYNNKGYQEILKPLLDAEELKEAKFHGETNIDDKDIHIKLDEVLTKISKLEEFISKLTKINDIIECNNSMGINSDMVNDILKRRTIEKDKLKLEAKKNRDLEKRIENLENKIAVLEKNREGNKNV